MGLIKEKTLLLAFCSSEKYNIVLFAVVWGKVSNLELFSCSPLETKLHFARSAFSILTGLMEDAYPLDPLKVSEICAYPPSSLRVRAVTEL